MAVGKIEIWDEEKTEDFTWFINLMALGMPRSFSIKTASSCNSEGDGRFVFQQFMSDFFLSSCNTIMFVLKLAGEPFWWGQLCLVWQDLADDDQCGLSLLLSKGLLSSSETRAWFEEEGEMYWVHTWHADGSFSQSCRVGGSLGSGFWSWLVKLKSQILTCQLCDLRKDIGAFLALMLTYRMTRILPTSQLCFGF